MTDERQFTAFLPLLLIATIQFAIPSIAISGSLPSANEPVASNAFTLCAGGDNPATTVGIMPSVALQASPQLWPVAPATSSFGANLRSRLLDRDGDPTDQFSIRNYYFDYKHGEFRDNVVLRFDTTATDGLTLAAEAPLSTVYRNHGHSYGTGDTSVEAVYTPWDTDYFALRLGGEMVIPTASSGNLGSGKWQLAPILIPVLYPLGEGRLQTYLELENFISIANVGHFSFVSVAGDAPANDLAGPQINYLELRPVIRYAISDRWYVYTEPVLMTVNWEKGEALSYRSAFRIARQIRDRIGIWLQPEVPFGSNRTGDFNLKVSVSLKY